MRNNFIGGKKEIDASYVHGLCINYAYFRNNIKTIQLSKL